MRTSWIPTSRACNNRCRFCDVASSLDGQPIPGAQLRTAIDTARTGRAERVIFTGGEPTRSGDLLRAISYAHGLGLRVGLTTHGRSLSSMERIGRLQAAGLDEVRISLHGAVAATHVDLVGGDPVAYDQTIRAIALCAPVFDTTVRTVLTTRNAGELEGLVTLAAAHGARFELIALRRVGAAKDGALALDEDAALDAWRVAFAACARAGVSFSHVGFSSAEGWARPAPFSGAALDDATRELLRHRLHDAPIRGGMAEPDPALLTEVARERGVDANDLPALLAAERTPLRGVPRRADAPASRPLVPGTRVLVIVDDHADPLVAASTLPGLAHALAARGVDAHLLSMYRRPFDPEALSARTVAVSIMTPGDARPLGPEDPLATPAVLARASVGLARRVGELARDVPTLAVFWGFASAELWRNVPELRDAIVHVLDPGTMEGMRSPLGPHDVVHAANPTSARARAAATGLGHVRWAPLPAWLPHVAPVSASGRQLLVPDEHFERASAIAATWTTAIPLTLTRFDPAGPADTVGLHLATARAMWIPATTSSGPVDVRALSLARAAGLPLVGSRVPSIVDHVRPDDALLVPPDDAAAHGIALYQLATDAARLALLRHAARVRRELASVERLADAIVHGEQGPLAVPLQDGLGPWWSW